MEESKKSELETEVLETVASKLNKDKTQTPRARLEDRKAIKMSRKVSVRDKRKKKLDEK